MDRKKIWQSKRYQALFLIIIACCGLMSMGITTGHAIAAADKSNITPALTNTPRLFSFYHEDFDSNKRGWIVGIAEDKDVLWEIKEGGYWFQILRPHSSLIHGVPIPTKGFTPQHISFTVKILEKKEDPCIRISCGQGNNGNQGEVKAMFCPTKKTYSVLQIDKDREWHWLTSHQEQSLPYFFDEFESINHIDVDCTTAKIKIAVNGQTLDELPTYDNKIDTRAMNFSFTLPDSSDEIGTAIFDDILVQGR